MYVCMLDAGQQYIIFKSEKMNGHVLCFSVFVAMVICGSCSITGCPRFATEENGSCYWIIPFKYNRSPYVGGFQAAAHNDCGLDQPGSGLVTINTIEENNFIFEWIGRFAAEPTPVWTGLYQPRVAWQGPIWFSGERGILDLVEPLDYGEGAVLFLNDLGRYGPRWESEDPFEWGSKPSALCEYKLSQTPPTASPSAPTTKQRTIPLPGASQQTPTRPRKNVPRRPYLPSYHPFGPGPLSLHKPVGKDGFIYEVIRQRPIKNRNHKSQYKSGKYAIAHP